MEQSDPAKFSKHEVSESRPGMGFEYVIDYFSGDRAVVQVFEGTTGIDVKKVGACPTRCLRKPSAHLDADNSRVHWTQPQAWRL